MHHSRRPGYICLAPVAALWQRYRWIVTDAVETCAASNANCVIGLRRAPVRVRPVALESSVFFKNRHWILAAREFFSRLVFDPDNTFAFGQHIHC